MPWAEPWTDPATASLPAHVRWQTASAAGLGSLLLDEALTEYGTVDPDTPSDDRDIFSVDDAHESADLRSDEGDIGGWDVGGRSDASE